ncbi:unnamed protein product, partial [Cyprideis torosa]
MSIEAAANGKHPSADDDEIYKFSGRVLDSASGFKQKDRTRRRLSLPVATRQPLLGALSSLGHSRHGSGGTPNDGGSGSAGRGSRRDSLQSWCSSC